MAKKLSRRKFLEITSKDFFAGIVGMSLTRSTRNMLLPSTDCDLVVAKGGSFSEPFIAAYYRLKVALDAIGGIGYFVSGKKALIKVNAIDSRYHLGNTSSEVVGAVVKLCIEAGAKSVTVLSHDKGWEMPINKHPSLKEAIISQGGKLLKLTNNKSYYVKQPLNKGKWRNLYVAKILYNPDTVLINVPRAKTHPWTCYTMCIKNLMGLVRDMSHFHSTGGANWTEFPVRLSTAYNYIFRKRIALNILDATYLVYGWHSPSPEKMGTFKENAIFVGRDALAVDSYAIEMFHRRDPEKFMTSLEDWNKIGNFYAKYNYSQGNYIKECYALNAGEADLTKLKIKMIDLDS